MKNILLLLISFLFLQFTAMGQNGYSISPESFNDSYNEDLENGSYFRFDAFMENSSDTAIAIYWEIINIDLPVDWGLSVNDKYVSYPPGPPITTSNSTPLVYDPGEGNIPFNLHLYPNQAGGCGSFDVLISLEAGDVLDTVEYKVSVNDDGCLITAVESPHFEEKIELFPNPFVDHLQIHTESTIQLVTIYDLHGKKVDTRFTNFQDLDLSNVESGIYFIEIVSDKGHKAIRKIVRR